MMAKPIRALELYYPILIYRIGNKLRLNKLAVRTSNSVEASITSFFTCFFLRSK